jgi:hypothetical protein
LPAGFSPVSPLKEAYNRAANKSAFWRERRQQNLAVMSQAPCLSRAPIDGAIAQSDRVLSGLEEEKNRVEDCRGFGGFDA